MVANKRVQDGYYKKNPEGVTTPFPLRRMCYRKWLRRTRVNLLPTWLSAFKLFSQVLENSQICVNLCFIIIFLGGVHLTDSHVLSDRVRTSYRFVRKLQNKKRYHKQNILGLCTYLDGYSMDILKGRVLSSITTIICGTYVELKSERPTDSYL